MLCASDTRLERTETECRPTTQMGNQTSYMAGYLLFGVLEQALLNDTELLRDEVIMDVSVEFQGGGV